MTLDYFEIDMEIAKIMTGDNFLKLTCDIGEPRSKALIFIFMSHVNFRKEDCVTLSNVSTKGHRLCAIVHISQFHSWYGWIVTAASQVKKVVMVG